MSRGLVLCVLQLMFLRGSMESIHSTLKCPKEPVCVPVRNKVKFNVP